MTSSGGAQFHGSIHGSQIAIGGHHVTQHQYVTVDEGASARLAEAALAEAARSQPDVGRLRDLLGRIRTVLASVAAGAATGAAAGAGTGAAELAHAVLVDLQNALP